MVRLMLDRMSLDNRKAYLDLDKCQSNSVHKLCSIWGTNSFHFPELDKLVSGDDSNVIYTMVLKRCRGSIIAAYRTANARSIILTVRFLLVGISQRERRYSTATSNQ
ncbi:hypothetical protein BDQ17DRAFT_543299 [Cyathus striatus]|nr:hypothetical protein BDQ17DRAFT_543299 [Cyathus striatus]